MSPDSFFRLLRRALAAALADNCFAIAKAAAFSGILAFFPGLIVLTSLLFRQNADATVRELSAALGRMLPRDASRLAADYLRPQGLRTLSLVAGAAVIAVTAASDTIASLMEGFRAAYRLPKRASWKRTRLVSLALVALAGVPLWFASLLLIFARQIETWLLIHFHTGWMRLLWGGARWAVPLTTILVVLAILYHMAPHREQEWRFVWPGAALATVLWLASSVLFGLYVRYIAPYHAIYGSLSATVVLLIWMFLINFVILVGCEFNAEYERSAALAPPEDLHEPAHVSARQA